MKIYHTPILAIALAFAGCVGGPAAINPTEAPRKSLISPNNTMPDVRLSAPLASLQNEIKSVGIPFRSETGKALSQIFSGGPEAKTEIDLVNSSMTASSSDFALLLNKTQVFFTLSISVRGSDGSKHILNATGMGTTTGFVALAIREAIERAAIDLAAQIRASLQS
jgi:hypothetical protein